MNLTDGCVTQTLDYQPDYAENNTIEESRGIITGGRDCEFESTPQHLTHNRGQCSTAQQNYTCEIEQQE